MKKEQIWDQIAGDCSVHRYVGTINHTVPKFAGTAFQLIARLASRAAEVNDVCAGGKRGYFWRVASGAIQVRFAPRLGAYASALGPAFVAIETCGGQGKVHARIRSRDACGEKGLELREIPRLARNDGRWDKAESGEEDLGFGFDDEEGVGIGVAVGAELFNRVVEGGSEGGEDDGTVVAADEVEAALLLDEF